MRYYKKYLQLFLGNLSNNIRWGYLIFFVTNRCNAKCMHCFYWKNLNQKEELSLKEIEQISKKLGTVQVLLLSGGEPVLRTDLFDVISMFINNNKTRVVSIPTNALLPQRIAQLSEKLASSFPEITFSINPSIDGLYERNDEIRGIKGAFERSIETLREVGRLREKYHNIELVVNTTVSVLNYRDVDKMIEYFKKFNLTYHNFELLRGSPKERSLSLPSLDRIKEVHSKAIHVRNYYIDKRKSGILEKISVLGITKYSQSIKENVLDSGGLPFVCSAGRNIIVIEPDGNVKLCELLSSIGNLKDYDYDIELLLRNKKATELFKTIKDCRCTHVCFINMSIANDKKTLFKVPLYYLKWKK